MDIKAVFLSSTGKDLQEYRDKVFETIDGLADFKCIRMETFGAQREKAIDVCLEKVKTCDLFIGILGHCYGSIVKGRDKSYTELEYEAACQAPVDKYMFVAPENFAVPHDLREEKAKEDKQKQFRERVQTDQLPARFDSPQKLADEVHRAIINWYKESGEARSSTSEASTHIERHAEGTIPERSSEIEMPLSSGLQVIGWKGIENEEIYSEKPENIQDVACLVTPRSLADLPSFTYRKMGFDLVVADIEFIQRYIGKNLLADISPKAPDQTKIETAWDDILPAIANSTEHLMRSQNKLFGIPLQFGFMEILINRRHFDEYASEELNEKLKTYRDGDLAAFSYKDFCVSNIFSKTEVRIGLWDWFLPCLTHLLLTRFDWSSNGAKEKTVKDFATMIPSLKEARDVVSITSELREKGGRVRLYNNLLRLIRHLRHNKIGIVFGGTSSLLALREDEDIIPIIPKEGLLIWVNCGCLLEPDINRERSLELLQYWIKDGTQERLCGYEEYRACPVRQETMMKTLASRSHPAHSTLKSVLGDDGDWRGAFKDKIAVRTFPKNAWRSWESAWEENVSVIGQEPE